MTSAITTEDWSLQHCQDYLVELEMVTSGAMMALRLTANDINSEQVSPQAEHLGSRARKAKNMALELRQKHLDAKLQVKDRPARTFQETMGGTSGPGPGRWRGYSGLQFSGLLEDSREFKRNWDEYERQYLPKESLSTTSSPWTSWTCCCACCPLKKLSDGGDGAVRSFRKTCPSCSTTFVRTEQQT